MLSVTQFENDPTYQAHDKMMVEYWDSIHLVDLINERNRHQPQIVYLEGPPFISGSGKNDKTKKESSGLHAGHCLVSEIKSCIIKYLHMNGYYCLPYTGTDNHGLPIENFVGKLLGLSTPNEIREYGVPQFNQVCKQTIIKYETLWDPIYKFIGRPIDLSHRYKTMDFKFMESVIWVFKTLWDKDLIYRGWKILPYSYKCGTVLSNFEVSQCYKDVTDTTVYVCFKLIGEDQCSLVAWTTTPWTLPSNLALCVHPDGQYVKVTDKDGRSLIVHERYVDNLHIKDAVVVPYKIGRDLAGMEYIPPFPYFSYGKRVFKVICDPFVEITGGIGTGVVHCSPMHGEIDYDVCLASGVVTLEDVIHLQSVDDNGNFTSIITDFAGQNVFDANENIIDYLLYDYSLLRTEKYTHSYPHSDRTGEPIIYRAMSSYFVKVSQLKDQLMAMNQKINWVPKHVGSGRFQNWLENVKDWSISRSRFFGTPIPVWISDDEQESICIGSVDQLVQLAKLEQKPTDLHPEFIDKITIISPTSGKCLHRVPFVLDCWFESGSVPYGQIHYPFEHANAFDHCEYLSDFICEGIDQTRGWFYTLLVLSTALLNKPAYHNVICTGLVLDKEGKKMSKRNGNFKDPMEIIEKFGSDSLRMYLLGSAAVRADSLNFDEDNILLVKQKLIQLQNGIKFFIEHYLSYTKSGHTLDFDLYKSTTNIFDQWILVRTKELIRQLQTYLDRFDIDRCPPLIYQFIEDFTNWYIKLSRSRMRGTSSLDEWAVSLSVTRYVIINFIKAVVPFMPFLAEYTYNHINNLDENPQCSIHMCQYPAQSSDLNNEEQLLLKNMEIFRDVLTKARAVRSKNGHTASIRKPIKKLHIGHDNETFLTFVEQFKDILCDEVNCLDVEIGKIANYISYRCKPIMKAMAIKYKKYMKQIKELIEIINQDQPSLVVFYTLKQPIRCVFNGEQLLLTSDEIEVIPETNPLIGKHIVSLMENNLIVGIDIGRDDKMTEKYIIRQFCMMVQNLRKKADIHPWDIIYAYYHTDDMVHTILQTNLDECQTKLKCHIGQLTMGQLVIGEDLCFKTLDDVESWKIHIDLYQLKN
jgi:isoleucyl-tRNA synthetase